MQRPRCKILYAGILLLLLLIFLASSLRTSKPVYIFDTHEHIQGMPQAEILLAADRTENIKRTLLLPTPTETLTLNGSKSFSGYKENTDELFRIAQKYPDNFVAFCTASPLDPNAAENLADCVKNGGKGVKLYNGHSYYYEVFRLPLDTPRMMPIYSYAEKNKLPVLYHINVVNYGEELKRIMDAYPALTISVPHFMVSSIDLDKVTAFLDKFPTMYTDISFGSPEFMAAGFRRISKDPGKFVKFFNKYQDRILFGADMVLTDNASKDLAYTQGILKCYKDLLEQRRFTCPAVSAFYEQALTDAQKSLKACQPLEGTYCQSMQKKVTLAQQRLDDVATMNGLGLSDSVLSKIYWNNAQKFLEAK